MEHSALEEVHVVAVRVAEDLELDVVRALHETFEEHALVAKGTFRLASRALELRLGTSSPSFVTSSQFPSRHHPPPP